MLKANPEVKLLVSTTIRERTGRGERLGEETLETPFCGWTIVSSKNNFIHYKFNGFHGIHILETWRTNVLLAVDGRGEYYREGLNQLDPHRGAVTTLEGGVKDRWYNMKSGKSQRKWTILYNISTVFNSWSYRDTFKYLRMPVLLFLCLYILCTCTALDRMYCTRLYLAGGREVESKRVKVGVIQLQGWEQRG